MGRIRSLCCADLKRKMAGCSISHVKHFPRRMARPSGCWDSICGYSKRRLRALVVVVVVEAGLDLVAI